MGSGTGVAPNAPPLPEPGGAAGAARSRVLLAVALTAAGLLQIAGSLFGSPFLIGIGQLTGIAPLPRVFSQRGNIDSVARRAVVEIRTADGGVHEIEVGRRFGRRIEGPVVRAAAYAHAALFAGLSPSPKPRALIERAFCTPGDVARELGIAALPQRIRVRNRSVLANDEPYGVLEIRCPSRAPETG